MIQPKDSSFPGMASDDVCVHEFVSTIEIQGILHCSASLATKYELCKLEIKMILGQVNLDAYQLWKNERKNLFRPDMATSANRATR